MTAKSIRTDEALEACRNAWRAERRALWLALAIGLVGGVIGGFGCAAQAVPEDETPVAGSEEKLINNGGGPSGASYSCDPNGLCTCDKSIENDCEDMSGICRDADIDNLIRCINGWLTTHCTCTMGLRRNPTTGISIVSGGVRTATAKASF